MNKFPAAPLIVDLETVPAKAGQAFDRVIMVGALRADLEQSLELTVNKSNPLPQALAQLDQMTAEADCLLGHNIVGHDRPVLQQHNPQLRLLDLPVVDTLQLSPLAFPKNPYHRLVKDYKLVRDSLNSPLADCRATWVLFEDQREAFRHLSEQRREELICYQALIGADPESGMGRCLPT